MKHYNECFITLPTPKKQPKHKELCVNCKKKIVCNDLKIVQFKSNWTRVFALFKWLLFLLAVHVFLLTFAIKYILCSRFHNLVVTVVQFWHLYMAFV